MTPKTLTDFLVTIRQNLFEHGKIRYRKSATTSSGNSGGTTAVDSGASSFVDGYFNGCYFRLLSGTGARQKEVLVSGFTSASGTFTFAETIGLQVASGVSYEVFEKGIFTDVAIIDWINAELAAVPTYLNDDALVHIIKKTTTSGTSGVASLPSDALKIISVEIGGRVAALLNPDEKNRFTSDPWIPAVSGENYVAIFTGSTSVDSDNLYGRLEYRPNDNATVTYTIIPKLPDISSSQSLNAPEWLFDILCLGATARAFLASEDFDNYRLYKGLRDERISVINQGNLGRAKVEK